MLLYPTIDKSINEHGIIQEYELYFSTIDFMQDNNIIKKDLLSLFPQFY